MSKKEDEDKKKRKKKVKEIKNVKLEDEVVKNMNQFWLKLMGFQDPQLGELIVKYDITNPSTGGKLEPPVEFNLMFDTAIGPSEI